MANLSCHGKAIIPLFLAIPLAIISAACSPSMKKGMGQVFWSVMRERTKPGQITETLICSSFNLTRKASPQALTQAFEALYAGQVARP